MKVDYDLYYKDSGSVNKGHYVESNESVSISLSHDYTTPTPMNIMIIKFPSPQNEKVLNALGKPKRGRAGGC